MGPVPFAVLIGIFSSLVATVLFLVVLLWIRPKIEISKRIAVSQSKVNQKEYQIKIVNRSRFPALNVQARLFLVNPSGPIYEHEELRLKIDHLMILGSYKPRSNKEDYAWRFLTYEDVETRWGDPLKEHVIIQIIAYHWLSGFCRVFTKKYYQTENVFVPGEFPYGPSMEIG